MPPAPSVTVPPIDVPDSAAAASVIDAASETTLPADLVAPPAVEDDSEAFVAAGDGPGLPNT
jgi:hypothetical protein